MCFIFGLVQPFVDFWEVVVVGVEILGVGGPVLVGVDRPEALVKVRDGVAVGVGEIGERRLVVAIRIRVGVTVGVGVPLGVGIHVGVDVGIAIGVGVAIPVRGPGLADAVEASLGQAITVRIVVTRSRVLLWLASENQKQHGCER